MWAETLKVCGTSAKRGLYWTKRVIFSILEGGRPIRQDVQRSRVQLVLFTHPMYVALDPIPYCCYAVTQILESWLSPPCLQQYARCIYPANARTLSWLSDQLEHHRVNLHLKTKTNIAVLYAPSARRQPEVLPAHTCTCRESTTGPGAPLISNKENFQDILSNIRNITAQTLKQADTA